MSIIICTVMSAHDDAHDGTYDGKSVLFFEKFDRLSIFIKIKHKS